MKVNGVELGNKPLTKGQIKYLAERFNTVKEEIEREYGTSKANLKVIAGKGYVGIGIYKKENKGQTGTEIILHTDTDEEHFGYKNKTNIKSVKVHLAKLKKQPDWQSIKPLIKNTLRQVYTDEFHNIPTMAVEEMTLGNFTKLTKKKGLRIYQINPYDSLETLYRKRIFVTDKVKAITKVKLKNTFKFVAIPNVEILKNGDNLNKVLKSVGAVQATHGTVINEETGKIIMRYQDVNGKIDVTTLRYKKSS